MTDNPYQPAPVSNHPQTPGPHPSNLVFGPALALMIITGMWLAAVLLGLAGNIVMLATGNLVPRQGVDMSPTTIAFIQIGVAVFFLLLHSLAMWGAFNMMKLKSYSSARSAAIVAVIPCISPCYILGIPFGIWALVVLSKPHVKQAFES
ncbi:hypothetical protein [Mariniblastus fucicola]|nr:hypothetical protein [Mariniblastus fucicola]